METSSPLAAMYRPMDPFAQRDIRRSNMSPGKPRVGGIFNRPNRSRSDYFGLQPVHGSSPAGSLAADLCQNFRIGEDLRSVVQLQSEEAPLTDLDSPPIPTPRRALFTAAHLAAAEEDRGKLQRRITVLA